ncbi:cryptochrome/photolyase family protein [Chryseobacterium fluminis]|uniref:cryptochrome/photolyase family protein n=1 Tax=Chryseobacterium fluminis TaxID=2983606 RepID=UPI002B1CB427|nr:cryptochrome/photolyase family protein [Chryseobacterium sp. MMS21-Ot14]
MAETIKHTAQLIFPNQLFRDTDYLDKSQPVFILEEFLFFKQYLFHKQKIAFHRASMKFYENELKKSRFKVEYIESTSELLGHQKIYCRT